MGKIINFDDGVLFNRMKNATPEQLVEMMLDEKLAEKLSQREKFTEIDVAEKISTEAARKIVEYLDETHGELADDVEEMKKRRSDHFNMCSLVCTMIMGPALALYEPEDREDKLKMFVDMNLMNAMLLRAQNEIESRGDE